MKIEFTGRQTEVPPEIRRLAERKLQKVTRLLPGITRAHVTLAADKHRQIAEVSIRSKHLELTAQKQSADLAASLSTVMDKLIRQVQRHLGRLRERKREGRSGPRRIVRSRRAAVRPLTLGLIEPEA